MLAAAVEQILTSVPGIEKQMIARVDLSRVDLSVATGTIAVQAL